MGEGTEKLIPVTFDLMRFNCRVRRARSGEVEAKPDFCDEWMSLEVLQDRIEIFARESKLYEEPVSNQRELDPEELDEKVQELAKGIARYLGEEFSRA